MSENLLATFEQLLQQGIQLVPLGGFEVSGYNARLQSKYVDWRKECLEALEQVGPIGFPYKTKIIGDANGGFFFQASAQLVVSQLKDLYEKIKASPELAAGGGPPAATSRPQTSAPCGDRQNPGSPVLPQADMGGAACGRRSD